MYMSRFLKFKRMANGLSLYFRQLEFNVEFLAYINKICSSFNWHIIYCLMMYMYMYIKAGPISDIFIIMDKWTFLLVINKTKLILVREQEWYCQSYNILNQRKLGIIIILLHEVVHTEFWSYIYNVCKTTLQAHHVFYSLRW